MTTLEELADISDAVCDQYFDVERLEHDVHKGELRIAIYPGRRTTRWMIEVSDRERDRRRALAPPL